MEPFAETRETSTRMFRKNLFLLALAAICAIAADKYDGPVPPKPDVPYLLHAGTLVETESTQAREEGRKNESTYTIAGASSPARTPLAEPIFLIDARELSPDKIELYRLTVKNGNREVSVMTRGRRSNIRALHLMVTKLTGRLYRIEADEPLENGEYALAPSGDNRAFCFQIY